MKLLIVNWPSDFSSATLNFSASEVCSAYSQLDSNGSGSNARAGEFVPSKRRDRGSIGQSRDCEAMQFVNSVLGANVFTISFVKLLRAFNIDPLLFIGKNKGRSVHAGSSALSACTKNLAFRSHHDLQRIRTLFRNPALFVGAQPIVK